MLGASGVAWPSLLARLRIWSIWRAALYRLRWQIELAFKRLKSLMGLEEIDAREPRLARAAVCAKLILAILAESLLGRVLALSPTR